MYLVSLVSGLLDNRHTHTHWRSFPVCGLMLQLLPLAPRLLTVRWRLGSDWWGRACWVQVVINVSLDLQSRERSSTMLVSTVMRRGALFQS